MAYIEVREVKRSFKQATQNLLVLKGIQLSLNKGQFVAIMGPSGSGKSTLLHLLGGLDRPSHGSILIDQTRLEDLSDVELSLFRRRKLGFIFQFFNLLPTLSALENVALPLLLDGKNLKEIARKAESLLTMMGLSHRFQHMPNQLSGGEMQRVAIARALVTDPLLILADEPTGNLDTKTGQLVLQLLRKSVDEQKQTVVMVTHDPKAASFADRLIQLHDGQIESDRKPDVADPHSSGSLTSGDRPHESPV